MSQHPDPSSPDYRPTTFPGGENVRKDDPRVEAYGTIDELNSFVGLLATSVGDEQIRADLAGIQAELFDVGSLVALPTAAPAPWADEAADRWLCESRRLLTSLPPMRTFVLPAGDEAACRAHVCRTVCRRAERRVCALPATPALLAAQGYLNRLSSYFFALSRYLNHFSGTGDVPVRMRPLE